MMKNLNQKGGFHMLLIFFLFLALVGGGTLLKAYKDHRFTESVSDAFSAYKEAINTSIMSPEDKDKVDQLMQQIQGITSKYQSSGTNGISQDVQQSIQNAEQSLSSMVKGKK